MMVSLYSPGGPSPASSGEANAAKRETAPAPASGNRSPNKKLRQPEQVCGTSNELQANVCYAAWHHREPIVLVPWQQKRKLFRFSLASAAGLCHSRAPLSSAAFLLSGAVSRCARLMEQRASVPKSGNLWRAGKVAPRQKPNFAPAYLTSASATGLSSLLNVQASPTGRTSTLMP